MHINEAILAKRTSVMLCILLLKREMFRDELEWYGRLKVKNQTMVLPENEAAQYKRLQVISDWVENSYYPEQLGTPE
jgi:hypothetical protein